MSVKKSKKVKKMNVKAVVSVAMLYVLLGMGISGILSYIFKYNSLISRFHVVFGLFFLAVTIFHLINNFKALKNYLIHQRFRKEMLMISVIFTVFLTGISLNVFPFKQIVDFGKSLRQSDEVKKKVEYRFTTHANIQGKKVKIDLRAGNEYLTKVKLGEREITSIPQIAIWAEDAEGNYLDTLYVSGKSATGKYYNPDPNKETRRPEALPVWSHKRAMKSEDGLFMPSKKQPMADSITSATPLTSFEVLSKLKKGSSGLKIKIEINKSFDFNAYFHKKAFPKDLVYSNSPNGQPSLVYEAILSPENKLVLAKLIGHGHPSGANGTIHEDLQHITTALDIVKGIVIEH